MHLIWVAQSKEGFATPLTQLFLSTWLQLNTKH
jgi:hypothetical protein